MSNQTLNWIQPNYGVASNLNDRNNEIHSVTKPSFLQKKFWGQRRPLNCTYLFKVCQENQHRRPIRIFVALNSIWHNASG